MPTACIAANCGSLDVIAMMALGAQYGILACHFYWIGAIPALIVVAFWLLPAYAQGRYPTVLDFIGRAYGAETRSLVALCMAAMMLLLAGVCLCAVAQVVVVFLGLDVLPGNPADRADCAVLHLDGRTCGRPSIPSCCTFPWCWRRWRR